MGHFPNLPHRYSPDAQEERNWKSKRKREGRESFDYNHRKYDKQKYRDNYDSIDWSK
jgi:hypothetical protein|tara:strand:+ start:525 stop:695 length:171 start_codon:yes stop_codon:yes gene_type:complete